MSNETEARLESEESILAYAQSKRLSVLETILNKGVPEKAAGQKVVFDALKDMEAAALGRLRIKIDEKHNANSEIAAKLIAEVLTGIHGKMKIEPIPIERFVPPSLPDHIPKPVLVPGEIDMVAGSEDYDSFVARMNSDSD